MAGLHNFCQGVVSRRENIRQNPPLVCVQAFVPGDDLTEFGLVHFLTCFVGVAAKQPHNGVGRGRQDSNDRPHKG